MKKIILLSVILLLAPVFSNGQELVKSMHSVMNARVVEVIRESNSENPDLGIVEKTQILRLEIISGAEKGHAVEVESSAFELKRGDQVYLVHETSPLEDDRYWVQSPNRTPEILLLLMLFITIVVAFGGRQGIRGLAALCASLFFILTFLLPGITQGFSPVLVSTVVASFIVLIASYVTHGFTKTTTAAVLGMIGTILITGGLAWISIHYFALSGWTGEEATYLHLNSHGSLDLAGLLLGSIIIGLLGVLYDAAIGQAVSVEELASAGEHLSRREIYTRALRIGREHVGALVNTLAIAYVGSSLPLILLLYGDPNLSLMPTLSQETFSTEIVRILVGSIGLVLAVPITTAVAVRMLVKKKSH